MKKTIRRLLGMLLCAVFVLPTFVSPSYAAENDLTESERYALAQAGALEVFSKIYNSVIYESPIGSISYHEDYAGCYINEQNVLVICVTKDAYELVSELNNLLVNQKFIIEYRNWSKNEAINAMESISDELFAMKNFHEAYYSVKDNAFIVELYKNSTDRQLKTPEIRVDSLPLKIRYIDIPVGSVANELICENKTEKNSILANNGNVVYGGDTIYTNGTSGYALHGSVGICGTYNGSNCLLTAGHMVVNFPNNDLYLSRLSSAKLIKTGVSVMGIGDYAVLKLPTGYTMSNSVYTTVFKDVGSIANYYNKNEIPDGTIIHKYGMKTQYTAGKVAGSNETTSNGSVRGLIKVEPLLSESGEFNSHNKDVVADHGDSGGPVWVVNASGNRVLLGIVQSGCNESSALTVPYYMLYSPIQYAVNAGFKPYNMMGTGSF